MKALSCYAKKLSTGTDEAATGKEAVTGIVGLLLVLLLSYRLLKLNSIWIGLIHGLNQLGDAIRR